MAGELGKKETEERKGASQRVRTESSGRGLAASGNARSALPLSARRDVAPGFSRSGRSWRMKWGWEKPSRRLPLARLHRLGRGSQGLWSSLRRRSRWNGRSKFSILPSCLINWFLGRAAKRGCCSTFRAPFFTIVPNYEQVVKDALDINQKAKAGRSHPRRSAADQELEHQDRAGREALAQPLRVCADRHANREQDR